MQIREDVMKCKLQLHYNGRYSSFSYEVSFP